MGKKEQKEQHEILYIWRFLQICRFWTNSAWRPSAVKRRWAWMYDGLNIQGSPFVFCTLSCVYVLLYLTVIEYSTKYTEYPSRPHHCSQICQKEQTASWNICCVEKSKYWISLIDSWICDILHHEPFYSYVIQRGNTFYSHIFINQIPVLAHCLSFK